VRDERRILEEVEQLVRELRKRGLSDRKRL
jgi:hypothetical protein